MVVYVVHIHDAKSESGLHGFGGVFSSVEKAKEICKLWNKEHGTENMWADFMTYDVDDDYILRWKG